MSTALSGLGGRPWQPLVGRANAAALLVAVSVALGTLSVISTPVAIGGAFLVLMLGLAFVDLVIFPVLALPATLVMIRVGGFISIADVVLAGATFVAIMLVSASDMRPMQPLFWAGVGYLAFLVPTLVLNPYAANLVEWAHEAVLILGSLVVGFVVGREGRARASLSIYVAICSIIGVWAGVEALVSRAATGHFEATYLPYWHKNFYGPSLGFAMIMAYARPAWVGWTRRWSNAALVTCAIGVAASGSRQAIIAVAVGILVVSLRQSVDTRRRSRLIWFALIPGIVFVISAVNAQLQSSNQFNSSNQRLMWFEKSIEIWRESPLLGVGLRWWYTDRFAEAFQPPNAEFEMLTSGGLLGLAGFLAMFSVAAWVLARMDRRYGTVALAVVVARFTQAQFDLYWVAGHASLLWIVAGIAFGVQCREREATPSRRPAAQPVRSPRG